MIKSKESFPPPLPTGFSSLFINTVSLNFLSMKNPDLQKCPKQLLQCSQDKTNQSKKDGVEKKGNGKVSSTNSIFMSKITSSFLNYTSSIED